MRFSLESASNPKAFSCKAYDAIQRQISSINIVQDRAPQETAAKLSMSNSRCGAPGFDSQHLHSDVCILILFDEGYDGEAYAGKFKKY